jgi:putative sigma-54 modulation protein
MEIKVQSVKFDASDQLLDYVNKKVCKIEKFYDNIVKTEVTLSLVSDHDNKNVKVRVFIPGNDIIVERNASKFEDAVNDCVDVIKNKIVAIKEKQRNPRS